MRHWGCEKSQTEIYFFTFFIWNIWAQLVPCTHLGLLLCRSFLAFGFLHVTWSWSICISGAQIVSNLTDQTNFQVIGRSYECSKPNKKHLHTLGISLSNMASRYESGHPGNQSRLLWLCEYIEWAYAEGLQRNHSDFKKTLPMEPPRACLFARTVSHARSAQCLKHSGAWPWGREI
jgi:hypothetical protein